MRFDTSEYPGVTVTLLEEIPSAAIEGERARIRVDNESHRPFEVRAGIVRTVIISPGGTKEFEVRAETFSMGWVDGEDVAADATADVHVVQPPPNPPNLAEGDRWPFPASSSTDPETTQPLPVALLGSSVQPATFPEVLVNMKDEGTGVPFVGCLALAAGPLRTAREVYRELQLGDVVAYAHAQSKLSVEEWNALKSHVREGKIADALELIYGMATPVNVDATDA